MILWLQIAPSMHFVAEEMKKTNQDVDIMTSRLLKRTGFYFLAFLIVCNTWATHVWHVCKSIHFYFLFLLTSRLAYSNTYLRVTIETLYRLLLYTLSNVLSRAGLNTLLYGYRTTTNKVLNCNITSNFNHCHSLTCLRPTCSLAYFKQIDTWPCI